MSWVIVSKESCIMHIGVLLEIVAVAIGVFCLLLSNVQWVTNRRKEAGNSGALGMFMVAAALFYPTRFSVEFLIAGYGNFTYLLLLVSYVLVCASLIYLAHAQATHKTFWGSCCYWGISLLVYFIIFYHFGEVIKNG